MFQLCFCQTAPLWEFREGPQNNRERAHLTLYFTRLNAGLTQAYYSYSHPNAQNCTNELTIYKYATNISFLAIKNSGLVTIIATSFLYVVACRQALCMGYSEICYSKANLRITHTESLFAGYLH